MQEGFGSRSGGEFWTIKKGFLAKRVSEGTEGAHAVKKENGDVYHEVREDFFTGRLKNVEIRTHEDYGDFLKLTTIAGGKNYTIECDLNSGYAFGFLSTIPNAKLEEIMRLSPMYKEENGKKESKLFIEQETGWLKQYFTKDTPNGLPELERIKVKGKETWDNTKRLEFFKNTLVPKLSAKLAEIWKNETPSEDQEAAPAESSEPTKLPF